MVDYTKLENEINNMTSGQRKPFGAAYSTEEFQEVYNYLLKLRSEGIIRVESPKRESMSGLRQVIAVFVEKL
ncbi:hypothetical protein [Acinetobacter sp.]|jgi:hypothetical protein|uniref:hypothetical protein n=1 Tax=Acinetobacter sp. TaxID=472 RepID=UPI002FCC145E